MQELCHDVVVIGAGPAGLAAAVSAAEAGRSVAVVDENAAGGGQIWRPQRDGSVVQTVVALLDRAQRAGVERLHAATVVHADGDQREIFATTPDGLCRARYRRLILATGATELCVAFPGWTLPGVTTVGGLQAMVKGGLEVAGKRVALVGSGPLLLAVAAFLRGADADVVCVVEQASAAAVLRFGATLVRHPRKLAQSIHLLSSSLGRRLWLSSWPLRALGTEAIASVVVQRGGRAREIACDLLGTSFGLVPRTRVAALLGCDVGGGRVRVDAQQRTSVDGVLAAGEATGVGGVDLARIEGRIAGLVAAEDAARATPLIAVRAREQRFVDAMHRAYALRPELRSLATDDTIICRCEDVVMGALRGFRAARDAKLKTRCGMGPCQGRVCGPMVEHLFGWSSDRPRPPLSPCTAAELSMIGDAMENTQQDSSGATSLRGEP